MLPPGWFRLSTSFVPTGSPSATITIGIVLVASLKRFCAWRCSHGNDVRLQVETLGREFGVPIAPTLGVQVIDRNCLSVNVAKVAQTFEECFETLCGRLRRARIKRQKAEPRDPLHRLSAGRQGPDECPAPYRNKCAPPHVKPSSLMAVSGYHQMCRMGCSGDAPLPLPDFAPDRVVSIWVFRGICG